MPHHLTHDASPPDSGWCVYVLRSLRNGRHYTGSTDDLNRRLLEHARGKTPYTRHGGPFELVHRESAQDRVSARRRERYLKSGMGREELRAILGAKED